MDKYKTIINLLYNYNMLKINIEIADKQLEELKEEDGIKGITYDGIQSGNTNKTSDSTGDTSTRNVTAAELILLRKHKLQEKLNTLDKLLGGLNEIERQIIIKKYIEGLQWWQVGYSAKYSERHCKRIRTDAINKLIIGMYGEGGNMS